MRNTFPEQAESMTQPDNPEDAMMVPGDSLFWPEPEKFIRLFDSGAHTFVQIAAVVNQAGLPATFRRVFLDDFVF
ncbi:MAG: hypothetical protein KBT84_03555 [Pseudomonas sp.]|nr:hypothetical protein [Pseudomonas sp.]